MGKILLNESEDFRGVEVPWCAVYGQPGPIRAGTGVPRFLPGERTLSANQPLQQPGEPLRTRRPHSHARTFPGPDGCGVLFQRREKHVLHAPVSLQRFHPANAPPGKRPRPRFPLHPIVPALRFAFQRGVKTKATSFSTGKEARASLREPQVCPGNHPFPAGSVAARLAAAR